MSATLSISETQVFTSLRAVLLTFGLLPANPNTALTIIRGQVNRVPEPAGPDFIVMWPLIMDRLALNLDIYADTSFIGAIVANILTVSIVNSGSVAPGQTLYATGIRAGCQVVRQLTGPAGGAGTYSVTPTPNVASGTFYNGTKALQQAVEWTVQLDVHGPASADNAQRIHTLWRDWFGVAACREAGGGLIAPFYAVAPRQSPFENAEMQFEERWTIDLCFQVNPIVTVTAQFADQLTATAEAVHAIST